MSVDSRFKKLCQPSRIGQMELRNRIVMAPMGTNFAAEDGHVTERTRNYYEERAKGGVGLIIVGVGSVDHDTGRCMPRQIAVSDDEFVPGLTELTQAVHQHGAKIAIQLQHGGKLSTEDLAHGVAPLTPSRTQSAMEEVVTDLTMEEITMLMTRFANMPPDMMTREITLEEITQLVTRFAEAAERARKAGFDGVEIHAGHGYLISEFLSRSSNKRQDGYGGELKNRARFLLEIIGAIREKVGNDYPVWCRMDGREFGIEDGITTEDAGETARMVEEAGLDAIHVSGYGGPVGGFYEAPLVYPPGNLVPLAEGIKKVAKIPVIAVGRISPELGEKILRQGKADFIAMGRPLLADPDLPNKLASGKRDDIIPCIYCYNCVGQIFRGESMYCTVNAGTGREADLSIQKAERAKKVVVVGGGAAGMEAARVAALRNHEVTLYEKGRRLGGTLVFASLLEKENEDLLKYLVTQIKKLPVKVKVGEEVTPELVEATNADATILAPGASLAPPQIPGVDGRNVLSVPELQQMINGHLKEATAEKLGWWQRLILYLGRPLLCGFLTPSNIRSFTKFWMPLGKRVVIMGGDLVGCQMAEFLVERGRKVTILESQPGLAADMSIPSRWRVMAALRQSGVNMITEVKYEEITEEGVIITTKEGERQTMEADTVILAEDLQPNVELFQAIEGKVRQVYRAGDSAEPRLITGAIADGTSIGVKI